MDVVGFGGQANLFPSTWHYGETSTSHYFVRCALSMAQAFASGVLGKPNAISYASEKGAPV